MPKRRVVVVAWVGLTGSAGAGKDWLCRELANRWFPVRRVSIADALKRMLIAMDPYVGGDERLTTVMERHGGSMEQAKWACPEIRRLLQRLGTEGGRACLGADVWIRTAMMDHGDDDDGDGGGVVLNVVTDVRFPNEAEALRAAGGVIVHVTRPGAPPDLHLSGAQARHASEVAIKDIRPDITFVNNGDDDEVRRVAVEISRKLLGTTSTTTTTTSSTSTMLGVAAVQIALGLVVVAVCCVIRFSKI